MPKINWAGADEDELITADDIDSAEDGYQAYTGDVPPGGVYRFNWRRGMYAEFNSGNQGLNVLWLLDGSWKSAHRKFEGCPLWDRVVMTKASAAFVKAFAAGIGVSASDLVGKVVVDEDGTVTKIGRKTMNEDVAVYIAVKPGEYNNVTRLEVAGTGYQIVETDDEPDEPDEEEARPASKPAKTAKTAAKKATAKAGKGKSKADDDEPPF